MGVRQKQRRREGLTASSGCKATVAVEGKKRLYTHEYLVVIKRKIEETLPCTGEERGRQTGVTGGSPASRRERADGLGGGSLVGDEEKLLQMLVYPATAKSY